ncbi:hypothetical protein XBJ1_2607 [Xenorhabdus bovienii SS-2004]|uniref:Uncharacterized protein n=1 Tax=Xenorhabdus bovienii (strain SS-2004) TaxID=406818 RepID=D3V7B9_XENBS|nr:hypothetical protein XBJ1_2607 [Xenorhabdus bovienii SS-2004]
MDENPLFIAQLNAIGSTFPHPFSQLPAILTFNITEQSPEDRRGCVVVGR